MSTTQPSETEYGLQKALSKSVDKDFDQLAVELVGYDGTNLQRIKVDSAGNIIGGGTEYETVAASQTAQVIGATGAAGDLMNGILVIPATTSPGAVTLLDNATSITIFTGGADSVTTLIPFFVPLGIKSVSGAWKITTGSSVSCIAVGDFT